MANRKLIAGILTLLVAPTGFQGLRLAMAEAVAVAVTLILVTMMAGVGAATVTVYHQTQHDQVHVPSLSDELVRFSAA